MTKESSGEFAEVLRQISHDLNNPIAALTMDLYLLRRAGEDADREATIANLERATSDLRDIVDDLERRAVALYSGGG